MVVNMKNVEFMDCSCLGALIAGMNRVRKKNCAIAIICKKQPIIEVFEITGLQEVFQIFTTENDAAKVLS